MSLAFFVSDIHGSISRYEALFKEIESGLPDIVFIGGDILPHGFSVDSDYDNFILDFMVPRFNLLMNKLKDHYPMIYLILGNDDPASFETFVVQAEKKGIWKYMNMKTVNFNGYNIYGYNYVPPTPFMLKDWENYDVSRYVDPGCVPVEEGHFSIKLNKDDLLYRTIQNDLKELTKDETDFSKSIFLFHSPPYNTFLDRAALDGRMFEYVPLDVHVGSIAIKRFVEEKKPFITMHGHVHESSRLTGCWCEKLGTTHSFNAAFEGKQLSLIKFEIENPGNAIRILI